MGYTTDFTGRFTLDKPLAPEHAAYLKAFSRSRRMKRDASIAETLPDPLRLAAKLAIGEYGGHFVGSAGDDFGQARDTSILEYNSPPPGQPGLWCQWTPSDDGLAIQWDEGEKFYEYVPWITYLIEHFLEPWGYVVSGEVQWFGEENDDVGTIVVRDNVVGASAEEESPMDEHEKHDTKNCRVCRGQQVLRANQLLGEVTRIAFAGGWRPAVEAHEQHADVERLPEVERLLGRAVRDAAKHNLGDAIDAARSALASCPGVPALAQDVARIITILEAL